MKRDLFILFSLIILLVLPQTIAQENNENISITGKVTAQTLNLAIQIVSAYPTLIISSPKNYTYWTDRIFLNFSASGEMYVWYSMNYNQNTTINSIQFINASSGQHILWIYANNSDGNITFKNVNFSVDTTKPYINYTNYSDSGNSTEFVKYSFEELQNLSNVIFEKVAYGKITFTENINVTDTNVITNNIIDLNKYITISQNSVFVNSTAIPNFNRSAIIELRGLAFTNPQILRDGLVCPTNECIKLSYSGGTLRFIATHFTVFSARETPVSVPDDGGDDDDDGDSSGSSGGGAATIQASKPSNRDIEILSEKTILSMKQGETRQAQFSIKNNERRIANVSFETDDKENLIFLPITTIQLIPGKIETIPFDVIIREDTYPDVYIKKILIKVDGKEIGQVYVVVDVSSKKSLFDVKIDILDAKLKKNQDLIAQIELYNFGETGRVDTELEYIIRDINNIEIYKGHETRAVETQLSLIKVIKTNEIKEGSYILYVKSTYDNNIASSSEWFEITSSENNYKIILIIALIVVILFFYYRFKRKSQNSWFARLENRLSQNKLQERIDNQLSNKETNIAPRVMPEDNKKIASLQQQLKQLEYVHSQKLIEDSEYESTKSDIKDKINELNNRR